MNKSDLRKKLNQPYSQENWKEIVDFVFPHFSEFSESQNLPIAGKDKKKVESFKQIGQVRLADGKNLALFELKLRENVNIISNRVALNDIVSSYIDQEQIHGVLSIFEQGKEDYRFTFSARASEFDEESGDFVTRRTDTKRFTYVLGQNESCKTPAERFFELSQQKEEADIQAIEQAFSVETLSKNFFKQYKEQYELFVDYLINTPSYYTAVFNNDDKSVRDWVKLLLGRLVFIKFVQKKGWLGVPKTEPGWQKGNYRFLEESFEKFEHPSIYYSNFLAPLFFDGFDQPNRPNDIFELTGTKVPFLSGGLFDNEDPKTKSINFPKEYFEGLFEFLERYNFTIDENDTAMDREVGIDPEMLGHIFENLLEDNKDKGAFYTPKEIVRYMCQESLKEYLKTYLQEHKQWSNNADKQQELETALHNFITKKEAGHVIDLDATLSQALKDVKICDPAIGSGAFPMGLLNEIFQLVHKLYDASPDKVGAIWEMDTWQPDIVKLNIIQQSIYGVDIEKGAVEIARLRFWLSLVVDSDEPHALPHLDYKIVVGDSLVSKLEDTIIDIDWDLQPKLVQADIFGNEGKTSDKRKLIKEITDLQKQIFNPESDDDALSLKIRNKKIDLLILQLEIMIDEDGVTDKPQGNSRQLKAMTEKWLQTKGWKQQIQRLKQMKQGSKTPLEFFDWKLDFPEIMNPEITKKTGFDIVIGNPPYISYYSNTGAELSQSEREYIKDKFESVFQTNERINSMNLFTEAGMIMCKEKGRLVFIVNKTMAVLPSYEKFREYILSNYQFDYAIIDLAPFEAIVDCFIFSLKNEKPLKKNLLKYYHSTLKNFKIIDYNIFKSNLKNEFIYSEYSLVLKKIEDVEKTLEDYLIINRGVNIGGNFDSFLSNKRINGDYLKYISGTKCIKPFKLEWKEEDGFMIFDVELEKSLKDNGSTMTLGNIERFNVPRIYIPESGQNIMAVLEIEKSYSAYGVLVGTSVNNDLNNLKSCYGILNSRLITFYSIQRNILRKGNKATPHVGVRGLRMIPFPDFSKFNNSKFIDIVEKLHEQFTEIKYDILNSLVYKLYDLTYDEVLIIEPAFSERMTKEEYEALKVD